jgi:hypothetical protein
MTKLASHKITTDPELQPRVSLDSDTAADYCEAIRAGAKFPPLTVFFDGETYWLGDGFHRHHAFTMLGAKQVPVLIHQGTRRDALLFSCGANATHGLQRSNEDKRRAVEKLLGDQQWKRWSSRQIARACGVSQPFVDKLRAELSDNGYQIDEPRLAERGGTVYPQKSRRSREIPQHQQPSDEAETLPLRQESLGRALEIISNIAMECEPHDFPVLERRRGHLRLARAWLNRLPE